jgi:hypothetical protein
MENKNTNNKNLEVRSTGGSRQPEARVKVSRLFEDPVAAELERVRGFTSYLTCRQSDGSCTVPPPNSTYLRTLPPYRIDLG